MYFHTKAVKPRRKREGVRKILGDVEWWEMMSWKKRHPRETKARFGKRVRAFAAVECEWDKDDHAR